MKRAVAFVRLIRINERDSECTWMDIPKNHSIAPICKVPDILNYDFLTIVYVEL